MARCVAFSALLFILTSVTAHASLLGSVSGLPGATGLAVDPGTGDLYVKSGISGTVWRVPVGSDGTLGTASTVSSSLGTAVHIAFDLAGNIYGIQPGGNPATLTLRRHVTSLSLVQETRLSLSGFVSFQARLTGPFAIEAPGGITNRLFFDVSTEGINAITLGNFNSGRTTSSERVGGCGVIRAMVHRPRFADLVAALPTAIIHQPTNGQPCTTAAGGTGFVSLQGIAWDNGRERTFVTDGGTGDIVGINPDGSRYVIARGLGSPTGIAYDNSRVFVAESAAGRVSAFSSEPPPTPTATPSATATWTPLPTSTLTASPTRTVTPTSTSTFTVTATFTPSSTATATDTRTATATPSVTATPSATATTTDTATPTASATPSSTPTASPTVTLTPIPPPCVGDCDGDGRVTISELILAVRIALDPAAAECAAVDRNQNGIVAIDELIAAVNRALMGCEAGDP